MHIDNLYLFGAICAFSGALLGTLLGALACAARGLGHDGIEPSPFAWALCDWRGEAYAFSLRTGGPWEFKDERRNSDCLKQGFSMVPLYARRERPPLVQEARQ